MKLLLAVIVSITILLGSAAVYAQGTGTQSVLAQFITKYGAPFAVSRGTYNNGLLTAKFSQEPNTIILVTIFPDGTFKEVRYLEGPSDNSPDESSPADDVVDSAHDDSSGPV